MSRCAEWMAIDAQTADMYFRHWLVPVLVPYLSLWSLSPTCCSVHVLVPCLSPSLSLTCPSVSIICPLLFPLYVPVSYLSLCAPHLSLYFSLSLSLYWSPVCPHLCPLLVPVCPRLCPLLVPLCPSLVPYFSLSLSLYWSPVCPRLCPLLVPSVHVWFPLFGPILSGWG